MLLQREGDVLGGRFVVGKLARQGGMGAVYRGVDRTSGADVAIKLLTADGMAAFRFAQEAALLAQLSSPSIVSYVSHGRTEQGEPFLVMEWLEGEDLCDRLHRGRLSIEECVELARAAARGLAVAHAQGVVHRDIKPSNLFLVASDPRRTKVLDFGVSTEKTISSPRITATGYTLGTVGYMAPEQAYNARGVDARADVFALGSVLFECLAGRRAFRGNSDVETIARILLDEAPSVAEMCPDAPPELVAIVARMLAKDRANRFEDASAVLRALDALARDVDDFDKHAESNDFAYADTIAPAEEPAEPARYFFLDPPRRLAGPAFRIAGRMG
jgi:serine/threonine protein kinase